MKRVLLLTASALLISAVISAQTTTPATQMKEQKKTEVKAESKAQQPAKPAQENHGQAVSTTAKTTPAGQGHGEAVSAVAKTQGETKQAVKVTKPAVKPATTGAKAPAAQANKVDAAKGGNAGKK
jgi:hypothetical protein